MFYDVAPDIPRHQMLGYAESVQDDVLVSLAFDLPHEARRKDENRHQYSERIVREEASKWRLLFQLDSQSSLEKRKWDWIWGDAGKIYFCIRDEDLKAKSFDKVAFEMQFT